MITKFTLLRRVFIINVERGCIFDFEMRGLLIFAAFLLIIFSSCEEEEECVGCNLNPKVIVDFQPTVSFDLTDSLFTAVKDSIEMLVDSLSGELTQEQIQAIVSKLESLRIDSASLDEDYNLFKSGKAKINEIFAPGSNGFEQFQDTVIRELALPVNMNSDTTTYYIVFHGFTDTLQLTYQRDIFQNLDGFRMRIYDIAVNEEVSTFDSLQVNCENRTCSNDQTTVFIYF